MKPHGILYLCLAILYSCTAQVTDIPEKRSISSIPVQDDMAVELSLDAECTDDSECDSFFCFIEGDEETGICVLPCDTESELCPEGYSCTDTEDGLICLNTEIHCTNEESSSDESCMNEEPAGAEPAGAEPAGAEPAGAEPAGAEPAGAEPAGAEPAGAEPAGAEPAGAEPDLCGNEIIDVGEECDGGEGCTDDCTLMEPTGPVCGNGIREPGEECDGNQACDLNCMSYDGSDGPDVIIGDHRDNTLRGLAGDDTIQGKPGNDLLIGGDGNDDLDGGAGDDELKGQGGNDVLRGGEGNDLLRGGNGLDLLKGSEGDDTLMGGDGADELRGGTGTDHLYGEAGDDTYMYFPDHGVIHIYPDGGGNDQLKCRQGANVVSARNRNGNLKLTMASGGEIIIHDQANTGTTIDNFDCPGYDAD